MSHLLSSFFLFLQRRAFFRTPRPNDILSEIHQNLTGGKEQILITYEPNVSEEAFSEELKAGRERDLRFGQSYTGPHRDDFCVRVNDIDIRKYGSQGQQRTAVLALKLAEREIYQNATGEYPVLLLDDVLSELDPRRQEFVLNRIAGGQVFITCCEDDRLPVLLGGKVFHVKQGAIG
mgnify:CR=1 FL=1